MEIDKQLDLSRADLSSVHCWFYLLVSRQTRRQTAALYRVSGYAHYFGLNCCAMADRYI